MKLFTRSPWIPALLIFILNLGLYLGYLPTQMSWAHFGNDGGDYLAAILTHGVPHPTGYPTYILLNLIYQNVPFSTPYWRGAFFSACMAALSSALLFAWLYLQLEKHQSALRNFWIAGLGCLAWAISPFLFAQAVIVDVHSLHAVFLILGLFWIDSLASPAPGSKFSLSSAVLSFLFGMGLGNHVTLLFLLPAAIYAAVLSARRFSTLAAIFSPLVPGLLVYLYLPWSASQAPAINWGDPQTLAGFSWLVSGAAYRGMLVSVPPSQFLSRLGLAAGWLVAQCGLAGVLLGGIGLGFGRILGKGIALSLAWTAIVSSLFALTYAAVDWTTYLLPLLIVWCAWIAAGAAVLWSWRWRSLPLGMLLALAAGVSLLWQFPATVQAEDLRFKPDADAYAQTLFKQAPPRAIVLTSSDLDTFPLWYYHSGLKQRPDLHVVVGPLTVFDWYRETIHRTYPDLAIPSGNPPGNAAWEILLTHANPSLPVCVTTVYAPPDTGVHFVCN